MKVRRYERESTDVFVQNGLETEDLRFCTLLNLRHILFSEKRYEASSKHVILCPGPTAMDVSAVHLGKGKGKACFFSFDHVENRWILVRMIRAVRQKHDTTFKSRRHRVLNRLAAPRPATQLKHQFLYGM